MIVRRGTVEDDGEISIVTVSDYAQYLRFDDQPNDLARRAKSVKRTVDDVSQEIEETIEELRDPTTVKKAADLLGQALFNTIFKDVRVNRR